MHLATCEIFPLAKMSFFCTVYNLQVKFTEAQRSLCEMPANVHRSLAGVTSTPAVIFLFRRREIGSSQSPYRQNI